MNSTLTDPLLSDAQYYQKLTEGFLSCHKNPTNVMLHFITTPLGLIGAFSLIRFYTKSSSANFTLTGFYLLSLLPVLPNGIFLGTSLMFFMMIALSKYMKLSFWPSVVLVILGYVLQDVAHLTTGEETFQASYSNGGHIDLERPITWVQHLLEHLYYLIPLCLDAAKPFLPLPADILIYFNAPLPEALQHLFNYRWLLGSIVIYAIGSYCLDSKNNTCYFPGTPFYNRVIQCSLLKNSQQTEAVGTEEDRSQEMKTIRDWVLGNNPPEDTSTHWWFRELPSSPKEAFDRCANAPQIITMFRNLFGKEHYCLDVLDGMNEIYVTGPTREEEAMNSDHVFYSRHVDGPFGFIPFVSVYRCLLGLTVNKMVTTHYPLAGIKINCCEGDAIGFDFNREVHYITRDETKADISDKYRITLKLHYCVYPRVLAPLGWFMGWLNTRYNILFRAIFLATIKPTNLYEHGLAMNVNLQTYIFDRLETLLGIRNVGYFAFVFALYYVTGYYSLFYVLTSYVHYIRYITTFYVRREIDFGSFKRDVLVFKGLALAQLFYHYFLPQGTTFELDLISLLMIAVGYTISILATDAIGIDRTYFAAELGLVEPKWIEKFPYGYIPHPMIVSQIIALAGFWKAEHFRVQLPYAIPIHIGLYVIHMLQEHFNIYQTYSPSVCSSLNKKKIE